MASGYQGYESTDPQAAVLEWRSCVPSERQLLPLFDRDQDRGSFSGSNFSSFNNSSSSTFSLVSTPSHPQFPGQFVESPTPQVLNQAQFVASPPHRAPWLRQGAFVDDPRNPQSQHYQGNPYSTQPALAPSKLVSPVHLGLQLRFPQTQGYIEAVEEQLINTVLGPSPEQSPSDYYAQPHPHPYYPHNTLQSIPFSADAPFLLNGQPVGPRPSNVVYPVAPLPIQENEDRPASPFIQRHPRRQSERKKPYSVSPPYVPDDVESDEESSGPEYETPLKSVSKKQKLIQSLVDPDGKIRPHQCMECRKRFVRTEHLKRHVKAVHRGIKDYACFLCGKRCSRLDNLRQHLKLHAPRAPSTSENRGKKNSPDQQNAEEYEDNGEPSTSNAVKPIYPLDGNYDALF